MTSQAEKFRCREVLGNLHRVLGMDSTAVEEEEVFAHASTCPDCRRNLRLAADVSGLGRKLSFKEEWREVPEVRPVKRLVEAALRENRRRLANAYYEMGRSLVVEGAGPNARIELVRPIKTMEESRLEGLEAIQSGLRWRREDSVVDWAKENESFSSFIRTDKIHPLEEGGYALETALRVWPEHEGAMNWRGQGIGLMGDLAAARAIFQRLISNSQSRYFHGVGFCNISWTYDEEGEPAKALPFSKLAMGIHKNHLMVAVNLFIQATEVQNFGDMKEAANRIYALGDHKPDELKKIKENLQKDDDLRFWSMIRKNGDLKERAKSLCGILFS